MDKIVVPEDDIAQYARWSPDGAQFAVLVDVDGIDGAVMIASEGSLQRVTPAEMVIKSFDWMPDSSALLVAYENRTFDSTDPLEAPAHTPFAIVGLDGTVNARIDLSPTVRAWYGIAVAPDGSFAVIGGGPEGPHAFDFDSALYRVDLRTGETAALGIQDNGPIYDPQFAGDSEVIAFVNGPDGLAGSDDNHLIAVDLEDASHERVTPRDDQVVSFSIRRCSGSVIYTSSGELRGYGNLGIREVSLSGASQSAAIPALVATEVVVRPDGREMYFRDYVPGRDGGEVQYHRVSLEGC